MSWVPAGVPPGAANHHMYHNCAATSKQQTGTQVACPRLVTQVCQKLAPCRMPVSAGSRLRCGYLCYIQEVMQNRLAAHFMIPTASHACRCTLAHQVVLPACFLMRMRVLDAAASSGSAQHAQGRIKFYWSA